MDFSQALNEVKNNFGTSALKQKNIIYILSDYGAFKEKPFYKAFYKLILEDPSAYSVFEITNSNELEKYIHYFITKYGIDKTQFKEFILSIITFIKDINDEKETENNDSLKSKEFSNNFHLHFENLNNSIKFLNIPLGETYKKFNDVLSSKCNWRIGYFTYILDTFLFEEKAKISLFKFDSLEYIYKITIEFEVFNTFVLENFGKRIIDLYISKYGNFNESFSLIKTPKKRNKEKSNFSKKLAKFFQLNKDKHHNIDSNTDTENVTTIYIWRINNCKIKMIFSRYNYVIEYILDDPIVDKILNQEKLEKERLFERKERNNMKYIEEYNKQKLVREVRVQNSYEKDI